MRPGGQYEGLLRCQEEGLIDHIVCSTHQPGDEVRQVVDSGKFEGLTLGVNLLNHPYRWDGVRAAADARLGVVAMNPLGGGLIPKHEKELGFLSDALQGGQDETPTEAALRFLVSCREINIALVGFTTEEQVDSACRVADRARSLDEEDLARIRGHLGRHMTSVCTACGYCAGCPRNVPVAAYMQFYNSKAMFGKTDAQMEGFVEGQRKWGLLAGGKADAGACNECGACQENCTQHLNIIERLAEIAQWETIARRKARLAAPGRWLRRLFGAVRRRL